MKRRRSKESFGDEALSASQTKRQRTTPAPGSSSTVAVKDPVEIPWYLFWFVKAALYRRKLWEQNKRDKRLKKDLKLAEGDLRYMLPKIRELFPVPSDWKYNPKTAGTLVSRDIHDDEAELVSVSAAVEKMINHKKPKIQKSCYCSCFEEDDPDLMASLMDLDSRHAREFYVTHLHPETKIQHLKQIFKVFGPLEDIYFPTHDTGHSTGFSFVRFAKLEHAKEAERSLNGKLEIDGRTYKVSSYREHVGPQPLVAYSDDVDGEGLV